MSPLPPGTLEALLRLRDARADLARLGQVCAEALRVYQGLALSSDSVETDWLLSLQAWRDADKARLAARNSVIVAEQRLVEQIMVDYAEEMRQ